MTRPQTGHCKKCGKEILWATTSPGNRPVPLDMRALVFSVAPAGGRMVAVRPTTSVPGERFLVSHFSTCPFADDFHRKPQPAMSGAAAEPDRHFSEPREARDE